MTNNHKCNQRIKDSDPEKLFKMQISSQVLASFLRILLIDLELTTLKMDFFEVFFQKFI